ncbi:MAG TPA: hypothetical protein VLU23_20390 [Pseudolabrys sp.]|nr:hypothetical protein [Pseudolabrys sp.]
MKWVFVVLGGMVAAVSAAAASDEPNDSAPEAMAQQTPPQQWTTIFSTETRYFSWHNNFVPADGSTGPGKGSEVYVPIAAQLSGKPIENLSLEITARGGWVKAVQSTTGRSGEVQTATDTVASATVTYLGWQGVQPFAALSTNLPTGKSVLLGTAANVRMDPDLVDITTFGEGFNLGPTFGFNFPISGSLLVTTSVGYTWRGRFDQESTTDPLSPFQTSTVNPGDNLTGTVAVNYQTGPFAVGLTGSITWETPTTVDETQSFKPGKRFLMALQSSYKWSETLGTTTLSVSAAHSNRNAVLLPNVNSLAIETLNSNSNVYRVGLQHLVPVGDLQVGPTGSVLYRDHNGYNSATLQFVPQKIRWAAGLQTQYAPSAAITFNARVEGVWTHENENPAANGGKFDDLFGAILPAATVPAISGTGWQSSIGINVKL